MRKRRSKTSGKKRRGTRANTNRRLDEHAAGYVSTTLKQPKDVSFFALKDVKTKYLDILKYTVGAGNPYADAGSEYWERTYHVHRNIGPDGRSAYVCPNMASGGKKPYKNSPYGTGGKVKCPVCTELEQLTENYEENKVLISSWRLKERQLFNVVDTKDTKKGIQIWDMSTFLFGEMLDAELEADREEDQKFLDFANWDDTGATIRISVEEGTYVAKGKGIATFKPKSLRFKRRDEGYENAEEEVYCLDDLLIVPSYDELNKVFLQSSETKNEEPKFRSTDVKKIKSMTDRELQKFVVINDIDIDLDDFDDLNDAKRAVIKIVKANCDDVTATKKKAAKKKTKKQKEMEVDLDDEEEEDFDDEEEEDEEEEDEDLDDDLDDFDDEDEDEEDFDDEDEDEEDFDDEEDEEDDFDDDGEEDDFDDDDEDEEPTPKRTTRKKAAKKTAKKTVKKTVKKTAKKTAKKKASRRK